MSIASSILAFLREAADIYSHARTGSVPESRRHERTRVNVWTVDGWANTHTRATEQQDRR